MSLRACFIVGPTATGKTAVAQYLAEQGSGTILSADSMLVYRGLDIGTAKPTPAERGSVPYWGIDCVDPDQEFSAGDYLRVIAAAARATCPEPARVIVVGGTGLYVDVLLRGLTSRPALDQALRTRLEELHQAGGVPALQAELDRVAPGRRQELSDDRNPRRLIRAIELAGQGIRSASDLPTKAPKPCLVGLQRNPGELQERIRQRVHHMYQSGLLAEAEALRRQYPLISKTARQAIGYAEAWACLDGKISQSQAEAATVLRTRQLAKRQMTWFRHQATMAWVEADPARSTASIAQAVEAAWKRHGPTTLFI